MRGLEHGANRDSELTGAGVAVVEAIAMRLLLALDLGNGGPINVAAVRADVARGEYFRFAVRADFTHQGVALFFQSPMSRYFHE